MMQLLRRTLLASPLLLLGPASSCASSGPSRPAVPGERIVSLGIEDVITKPERLAELRSRLDEVRATGITLSVGRPDWTAFPWPRVPDAESSEVRRTGRDYVAEAIAALARDQQGRRRTVSLVLDVLAPLMMKADPSLAGVDPQGQRSDTYASLTAVTAGPIASRLLDMAAEVSTRYRPASLSLTELHFNDATFGADDLRSYRRHSGQSDWPRGGDGQVVVDHPLVAAWRSAAVSQFVSRVRQVTRRNRVPLEMDVRVSWEQPAKGRPESGHDYDMLLTAADRLVVWNYFGESRRPPAACAAVAAALEARAPGRFVMSVGLWGPDEGTYVSPEDLAEAVTASAAGGARAVAVTPTKLMSAEHWAAVRRAWVP